MLNRLPEDEDELLDGMKIWPDNQPGTWYYLAVQEATKSHDNLNFDPRVAQISIQAGRFYRPAFLYLHERNLS